MWQLSHAYYNFSPLRHPSTRLQTLIHGLVGNKFLGLVVVGTSLRMTNPTRGHLYRRVRLGADRAGPRYTAC